MVPRILELSDVCGSSVKAKQLTVTLANCAVYVTQRLILRKRVPIIFPMFLPPSKLSARCESFEGNDVVIGGEIVKNLGQHLTLHRRV